MLNLTCRQTFSFTQARPGLWLKAAHAVEEATTDARPMPAPSQAAAQVERAALLCIRRSRYAQPSVRCVHALKRLVSEASQGRA